MLTRKRMAVVAVFALIGLALYLNSNATNPPSPAATPSPAPLRPEVAPAPTAASATDASSPAPRVAPTSRVLLPPVEPTRYDGGPRTVTGIAAVRMPKDKRANPGPRAQQQLEIVGYAFETLAEDVEECLAQWDAMDAGATGEVMLVFQIDKKGLQKSWVDSAVELPFGPKSCIANAVYGLDWANVVDEPAQISQRFELGRDGGSAP